MVKSAPANAEDTEDPGSIPGSGRSPKQEWQPTLVFLRGEFNRQRNVTGYSLMKVKVSAALLSDSL